MTMPAARSWLRFTGADIVFLIAALVVFASSQGRLLSDPGLGWHLRNIDAMIDEGGWLTHDRFSGPRGGQPWLSNQWLGELPFWLGERWAGLEGIAIVAAFILAFTLRCLYRMLESDGLPAPVAGLWTVLAGLAISCSWVARPNLYTLLFVMLTARCCEAFHAGRVSWRTLAWLPGLFTIWANTHGGFVAGLVLLAAAAVLEAGLAIASQDAATQGRAVASATTLVLCGLATCINPYGISLYRWIFQLLGNPYFMDLHAEWRSPQFHARGAFQFEWLMLLFPLVLTCSRYRPNLIELGFAILLFHFGLTGLRYLPLWVLVVTPLLARSVASIPVIEVLTRQWRASGSDTPISVHPTSILTTCLMAFVLLIGVKPFAGHFSYLLPEIIPTEALHRTLALHGQRPGSVTFHSYDWGGYLTWHGWRPDETGFRNWIDDRNEVQGQAHVEDYFSIIETQPGWRDRLDRAGVSIVTIQVESPLAYRLGEDAGWRQVYRDRFAVIFTRSDLVANGGE